MKKRIIAVAVVLAILSAFFIVPRVSFAQSGTYDEAVANFNAAAQNLTTQANALKEKMDTVKSLSAQIHSTLKEMKDNGKEVPDAAKEDLKKLAILRKKGEKERDIREARTFYSKFLFRKIKDTKKEIKEKKENGATEDELKPLFGKAKRLSQKLRNVAPFLPLKMSERSDEILKKANDLKENGKEKEAIKLLDGADFRQGIHN
jgi:ABC-type transporter Mla subunit MlaD